MAKAITFNSDIIVDDREPLELYKRLEKKVGRFRKKSNLQVEISRDRIEIGDYLLPNGICIERKSFNDLILSIISGRIWEQIKAISEYENPMIAITNTNLKWRNMYFSNSRYIHKSYYGFLFTLFTKYPNIKVCHFDDDLDFIDFLNSSIQKIYSTKKTSRPIKKFRKATNNLDEIRENILVQIPGLGLEKARDLLSEFGSIREISQKSIKQLQYVDGIGKKIAKSIHDILN